MNAPTQAPSKDLSMALLREWHLADERFDLEDWSRRVRNLIEDAPQFFLNEDGDIDFGPASPEPRLSGSAEPAGDAAAAAGAELTAALSRPSNEPPAAPVIPREPTDEMLHAGLYQSSHDSTSADVRSMWVDMWDKAAGASQPPCLAHVDLASIKVSDTDDIVPPGTVWQAGYKTWQPPFVWHHYFVDDGRGKWGFEKSAAAIPPVPVNVLSITDAYESGFGHGKNIDEIPNPYAEGTNEHRAYSLGYDEGERRRRINGSSGYCNQDKHEECTNPRGQCMCKCHTSTKAGE